jgi:hypothetical protein
MKTAYVPGYNPVTGEWNDTLTGDTLGSSVNTREAVPDVMTPYTWSALRRSVVGCFNATTLLRTGDRVLVDGAQGAVEVSKPDRERA